MSLQQYEHCTLEHIADSCDVIYVDTSFFFPSFQETGNKSICDVLRMYSAKQLQIHDLSYFAKDIRERRDFVVGSEKVLFVPGINTELDTRRGEVCKKLSELSTKSNQEYKSKENILAKYQSFVSFVQRIAKYKMANVETEEKKCLTYILSNLKKLNLTDYEIKKQAGKEDYLMKRIMNGRCQLDTDEKLISSAVYDVAFEGKKVGVLGRDGDLMSNISKIYGFLFDSRFSTPFTKKLHTGNLIVYFCEGKTYTEIYDNTILCHSFSKEVIYKHRKKVNQLCNLYRIHQNAKKRLISSK